MSGQGPLIFWTSNPALPGNTILVHGAGLDQATNVSVRRVTDGPPGTPGSPVLPPPSGAATCPPLQPSPASVKFVLPDTLKRGLFALSVETPEARTNVAYLNRPCVWWCQGDAGLDASPGGRIRLFGTCLGWGGRPKTTVVLKGAQAFTLTSSAQPYSAQVDLPQDLPADQYEVFVHNGYGGRLGWSQPLNIIVAAPEPWPAIVFNVRDFGAKADGTDDTDAIAKALQQAQQNAGGVVYFPRGSYKVTATLSVPPKTVLRGERMDLAHLYWTNPWNQRLPAVILGTNHFGLEDLTLTFTGADNGILADVPRQGIVTAPALRQVGDEASGIFLRRVRVRWLLYSGHMEIADANQIQTATTRDSAYGARGFLLAFGGKNIDICDCDLYSSGNVFNLVDAKGARIAHNSLSIGRCGWANFDGCDSVICEDNRFVGADNMVRQGVTFWSTLPMQNVYFAGNKLDHVYFHDREGMTTDGASGKYFGSVASSTGNSVTLPTVLKPDDLQDHLCFVLAGTGQGQWRSVVGNTAATLTVDRAWDVLPGSDSVIGVNHTVARFLILGNTMIDVGRAFQFYGTAMDSVVAQNRCVRAGGLLSHAARYPGSSNDLKDNQPQFFVQYLDNEVDDGETPRDSVLYHSVVGVESWPGTEGTITRTWPMGLAFIFRGNRLDSSAGILVSASASAGPAVIKDVIIERNSIARTGAGITVTGYTAGVVIRKNAFQEVATPLDGAGIKDALVEP